MEITTIINLISNSFIVLGMTFFILGVFGRKSQTVENLNKIERALLKVALCVTAAGSLYNVLTFSAPPTSEVVMNAGFGLLFIWAAWFHWKYFVIKK